MAGVPSARRVLTAWFPHWPAVAAGVPPEEPAAVLQANRVVAVSAAAAAEGVRIGLRRREAQARCPGLSIRDHDPDRDARRFEAVARAVAELVPLLEVTEPGLLTFATRGPSRYVGGDDRLAERITALSGGAPSIGIADGRFASGVAARCAATRGHPVIVPPGQDTAAAFLAPFPVQALHDVGGLAPELIDLLGRLGVRTLGAVAALAPTELLARFGTPGATAHDLATAADARPVDAVPPPPEHVVTRLLDDPVVLLDPLVFLAKQLSAELAGSLAGRGVVATRLAVEAETEHGERTERVWYRPVGLSPAAMVERVRWQLDGWVRQPGGLSGGVVMVRLTAVEVHADDGRQLGFWGGRTDADDWAARAATRLTGLLGEDAVVVPEHRGGRGPGDTYALVPIGVADLGEPTARRARIGAGPGSPPWPGRLPAPSPAVVFPEPVPCEVVDAAGRPVRVSGRGTPSAAPASVTIDGRRRRVSAWAGPWPVEERWWKPDEASRAARFQLVTDDTDAVLAVLRAGRWWVEATYR